MTETGLDNKKVNDAGTGDKGRERKKETWPLSKHLQDLHAQ